jgi:hypothetical protein
MLAEVSDIAIVTRHLEVSRPSLSPWNDQFGGMQVDDAEGWQVVGVIEDRAKGVVAELVLDVEVPKEGPRGAFEATARQAVVMPWDRFSDTERRGAEMAHPLPLHLAQAAPHRRTGHLLSDDFGYQLDDGLS